MLLFGGEAGARAEGPGPKASARKMLDEMVACMDRSFLEFADESLVARAERQAACLYTARRLVEAHPALQPEFERRILKRAGPVARELEAKLAAIVVWPPKDAQSARR